MDKVGLVLLAAGYGTRLTRDINSNAVFSYLKNTPKPLLPLGGRVLLSHWVEQFREGNTNVVEIVLVTNDAHLDLYRANIDITGEVKMNIVSDGTTSNENRVGAVAAMQLGVDSLSENIDIAVIVAGDTLLPDFRAADLLSEFKSAEAQVAICAYPLKDPADCVRRGMLRVRAEDNVATELVEKPASIAESPSMLACAPVYLLRKGHFGTFSGFLREHRDAPLNQRDAPGFWVRWIISRVQTNVLRISDRIDIGGLAHYREALARFCDTGSSVGRLPILPRTDKEPAVGRAYPRAGFLGNPSDGYGGKVIAIALESEGFAEVIATPSTEFSITHNYEHELPEKFSDLKSFADTVDKCGVSYGARQLVVAAATMFSRLLPRNANGSDINGDGNGSGNTNPPVNCELSYSTSIPTRLGLAGSSALILATFRALARFHNTSLQQMDGAIESWPARVLSVENEMLGIAGGLQDRVAQVYQGCVYMDFSGKVFSYERLDENRLPPLWIAYKAGGIVGECSGKVHNTLGKRFKNGDKDVIENMKQLAEVTAEGREELLASGKNMQSIAKLMRKNFQLRLKLVGEDVVGTTNMHLISTANKAGLAAKLSGSGGAVICMPDSLDDWGETEEKAACETFEKEGLVLHKVKVLPGVRWSK